MLLTKTSIDVKIFLKTSFDVYSLLVRTGAAQVVNIYASIERHRLEDEIKNKRGEKMKNYLLRFLNENQTALSEFGYGFCVGIGFCIGAGATYLLLRLLFRGFKK